MILHHHGEGDFASLKEKQKQKQIQKPSQSQFRSILNNFPEIYFQLPAALTKRDREYDRAEIDNVKNWTYESEDSSPLYPYIRQYVVAPLGPWIPPNLSPNVITILGFSFTLFNLVYSNLFLDSANISFKESLMMAFCVFAYFIFDALDGVQGRKWMSQGKDGYASAQLFDHGFDSLTAVCNVFVLGAIFNLGPFEELCLLLLMTITFLQSTIHYWVKQKMIFGLTDNPTESNVGAAVLIALSPMLPSWFVPAGLPWIAAGCSLSASVKFYRIYHETKSVELKREIGAVCSFFMLGFIVIPKFLGAALPSVEREENLAVNAVLYMSMIGVLFHCLTLNIISGEVLGRHVYSLNGNLIMIPTGCILILSGTSISFTAILTALTIGLTVVAACLWNEYSSIISTALNMKTFYAMPL